MDHESLWYMNTVNRSSRRLAPRIDEFQGYRLDIRYKGKGTVVRDALSRRPDYLNATGNVGVDNIYKEFITHIKRYLTKKKLPDDLAVRERVMRHVDDFTLGQDQSLSRKFSDGSMAPYTEDGFRMDFMEKLHSEFRHLSYTGIANTVRLRGWWPTMDSDILQFIAASKLSSRSATTG